MKRRTIGPPAIPVVPAPPARVVDPCIYCGFLVWRPRPDWSFLHFHSATHACIHLLAGGTHWALQQNLYHYPGAKPSHPERFGPWPAPDPRTVTR